MSHFIDQLELSVRVRNTLKLAGIASRTDFLAITQEAYRAMPNAILKGWPEILEMQAILLALPGIDVPKPPSTITEATILTFVYDMAQLAEEIENRHGQMEQTPTFDMLYEDDKNPTAIKFTTVDGAVFKLTIQRIS